MLQLDYRLGGKIRYFALTDWGELMQIPDEVRKCVAFIGYHKDGELHLGGTGFFVAVPMEKESDGAFVYFVTARHIIDGIRDKGIDRVVVRFNLRSKQAGQVRIPIKRWLFHPEDSQVDVAVLPWALRADVDYEAIPCSEMALTKQDMAELGIGLGDEVFLTGLFTHHRGRARNHPIIRVGNIAMMPGEPVETKIGPMEAVLIEARSIGGLSGSPVIVCMGPMRVKYQESEAVKTERIHMTGRSFYWLGLMHGHWDLTLASDALARSALTGESVNMGIAIVVPAWKIMEVINQERLVKQRKKEEEKIRRARLPTMDDASSGLTEEKFKDALRRVSRPDGEEPESQPDEERSET